MRPTCIECNKRQAEKYYYVSRTHKPITLFRKQCCKCRRPNQPDNHRPYKRRIVASHCIKCGFIPIDLCQLDVDHIDGNHKNNAADNLQVLCANCHRLKTKLNGDGIYNRD